MNALPADLREAIALGIARGYYTHTCVEEIAPLISAALADAWQDGYEAGHDHAPAEVCGAPGPEGTTCIREPRHNLHQGDPDANGVWHVWLDRWIDEQVPAAPSGVAQPAEGSE